MKNILGKHIILDIVVSKNEDLLNDREQLIDLVKRLIRISNTTMITYEAHDFQPYGKSVVAILEESHLSIHTWPEYNYMSLDLYTCGNDATPEEIIGYLQDMFNPSEIILRNFERGF